ncbi:MAG: efflux transporter outer membrane subunit [Verrucomicrobiales bacterium]
MSRPSICKMDTVHFTHFCRFWAVVASSLFSGCMVVGTDYSRPEMITPDAWHQSVSADLKTGSSSLSTWWDKFHDPTLNRLIRTARDSNRSLAIAYERINEARASLGVSRSQLFPTVDFDGSVTRNRTTQNLFSSDPPNGKTTDIYATGLTAGWEIDVFGGIRRSIESASATAEGMEELYRDAMVSLLADVALSYIEIRTFEERLVVARRNLDAQQKSLDLTQARLEAGLSPELDVAQAETNLSNTQAIIPQLLNGRSQAVNRLSVLLGKYPSATETLLKGSKGIPGIPSSSFVGIPADLLRSRPDVRAAERNLAAQNARVGVAEAELFPRFSLAGTFELQSLAGSTLLESRSRDYGFGPSFSWNIFNAGSVRNQIAIEESRTKQLYMAYEETVLSAVSEVEDSLASVKNERERLSALRRATNSATKAEELVTTNYTEGLVDFQNVLDAQRTVASTEDALATSQGTIAAGYVSLFRALGGGTPMKPAAVDPDGKP